MRKLVKRVAAVVFATALTVTMSTSCFAADRWGSYFGLNSGWTEAAYGELTQQSDDSWTAKLELLGWGGVWGAQVIDENISVKAGTDYTMSFDITSDTVDKWMFIKVTDGEDALLWGDWVQVKTGTTTSYEKKFKVDTDATKLVFGIGGEFGDRVDEEDMYKLTSTLPNDGDANYGTTLKLTNFKLAEAGGDTTVGGGSETGGSKGESGKKEEKPSSTTKPAGNGSVQTGDFTPIACATVAIIAAAGIVVFTRKREDA